MKTNKKLLGMGCFGYELSGYRYCLQIESCEIRYRVQQHLFKNQITRHITIDFDHKAMNY